VVVDEDDAQGRSTRVAVAFSRGFSQTNGTGAKEQRLGEPPETDASGELLRASAGSARLICLDADRCSWRSITNNFRSVAFAKQPQSKPVVLPLGDQDCNGLFSRDASRVDVG
jgi:hypothetical protein